MTANNDEPESVSRQNFCANCGRFAHSGVGMTEGGSMSMIGFSCPYCGHMNIEDTGIHSVERIDGRLQWVFREMTPEEMRTLRDNLKGVLAQEGVTPEEAATAVEPSSSALATMLRSFEDHQGLIGFPCAHRGCAQHSYTDIRPR